MKASGRESEMQTLLQSPGSERFVSWRTLTGRNLRARKRGVSRYGEALPWMHGDPVHTGMRLR